MQGAKSNLRIGEGARDRGIPVILAVMMVMIVMIRVVVL